MKQIIGSVSLCIPDPMAIGGNVVKNGIFLGYK